MPAAGTAQGPTSSAGTPSLRSMTAALPRQQLLKGPTTQQMTSMSCTLVPLLSLQLIRCLAPARCSVFARSLRAAQAAGVSGGFSFPATTSSSVSAFELPPASGVLVPGMSAPQQTAATGPPAASFGTPGSSTSDRVACTLLLHGSVPRTVHVVGLFVETNFGKVCCHNRRPDVRSDSTVGECTDCRHRCSRSRQYSTQPCTIHAQLWHRHITSRPHHIHVPPQTHCHRTWRAPGRRFAMQTCPESQQRAMYAGSSFGGGTAAASAASTTPLPAFTFPGATAFSTGATPAAGTPASGSVHTSGGALAQPAFSAAPLLNSGGSAGAVTAAASVGIATSTGALHAFLDVNLPRSRRCLWPGMSQCADMDKATVPVCSPQSGAAQRDHSSGSSHQHNTPHVQRPILLRRLGRHASSQLGPWCQLSGYTDEHGGGAAHWEPSSNSQLNHNAASSAGPPFSWRLRMLSQVVSTSTMSSICSFASHFGEPELQQPISHAISVPI